MRNSGVFAGFIVLALIPLQALERTYWGVVYDQRTSKGLAGVRVEQLKTGIVVYTDSSGRFDTDPGRRINASAIKPRSSAREAANLEMVNALGRSHPGLGLKPDDGNGTPIFRVLSSGGSRGPQAFALGKNSADGEEDTLRFSRQGFRGFDYGVDSQSGEHFQVTLSPGSQRVSGKGAEAFAMTGLGTDFSPRKISEPAFNGGGLLVIGDVKLDAEYHRGAAEWTREGGLVLLHARMGGFRDSVVESFATGLGSGTIGYAETKSEKHFFLHSGGEIRFWKTTGVPTLRSLNCISNRRQILVTGDFYRDDSGFFEAAMIDYSDSGFGAGKVTRLPGPQSYYSRLTPMDMTTDILDNHAPFIARFEERYKDEIGVERTYTKCISGDAKTGTFDVIGFPCTAMNDKGQIVGGGMWSPGTGLLDFAKMQGSLAIHRDKEPGSLVDINNNGIAVDNSAYMYVIGRPGEINEKELRRICLSDIFPAKNYKLIDFTPSGINDAGQIIGVVRSNGIGHGLLLEPITPTSGIPKPPDSLAGGFFKIDEFHRGPYLSWNDRSENEMWFEVFKTGPDSAWEFSQAFPANSTTVYTDESVMPTPVSGTFKARACSYSGCSDFTNPVTVATPVFPFTYRLD